MNCLICSPILQPGPKFHNFSLMSSRRPTSESRRSEFKNQGLTQDEFRRRREENSVELRKAKKEDTLNKRRNIIDVKSNLVSSENSHTGSYDNFASTDSQDFKVKNF